MTVALYLPAKVIADSIPLIWPHLDRFCKRFPDDYSLPEILVGLLSGQTAGFMAWEEEKRISHAFAFGSVVIEHGGQKCLQMAGIEGENLDQWQAMMDDEFTRFAKDNGCVRVRFIGRKGWRHYLPGWKVKYYVFERPL